MSDMLDRAYGCLLGVAIGDAMGMPASFLTMKQIKNIYGDISDFIKPNIETVHSELDAGEVTDDTEASMLIADVLLEHGGFDSAAFIINMREWAIANGMLDSNIIGPSMRNFLEEIIADEKFNGKLLGDTNGAAMRAAPIGICYHGNFDMAIKAAAESAMPSHASRAGVASACAVAGAVSASVKGGESPSEVMRYAYEAALYGESKGIETGVPLISRRITLAKRIVDENREMGTMEACGELVANIGNGMKAYESVPFSLGVFYLVNGDAVNGILAAVNSGNDADTNASITGGICGAYSGAGAIKPSWTATIEKANKFHLKRLAADLLTTANVM